MLLPEERHKLAEPHLRSLKEELRKVCGRFPAVEMFFAVRIMIPELIRRLSIIFYENAPRMDATIGAIGFWRIASYAVLSYTAGRRRTMP